MYVAPGILFWLFFLRMIIIWVYFSENYHDCLNDVKAATALQPSYLKAIIRGEMNLIWKSEAYLSFMRNDKWVDFFFHYERTPVLSWRSLKKPSSGVIKD